MFIPSWLIALIAAVVVWFLFRKRSIHGTKTRGIVTQPQTTEFDIEHDELSHVSADIDSDINYGYAKNHFRMYSLFDVSENVTEYEYKIADTAVLIRLLNQRATYPGAPDKYEILDGVVQESV